MKLTSKDYAAAMYVGRSVYISYDTREVFGDDSESLSMQLLSQCPSPEQLTILSDLFQKLRKDSKWLLSLMRNEPELLATPVNGKMTVASITYYLRKKRWNKCKIERAIREVQAFLAELETV